MAQLNKVMLIGNLTRDPEVRFTPKGSAVADIGIATNRTWRTESGEEKEEVCYVNVVVWGKQAESAGKYLKKGRPVFVEGRLQFESWEKNGEKRSTLKVHCERLQFLGSAGGGGGRGTDGGDQGSEVASSSSSSEKASTSSEPDLENDDIPF
jgi:single-strand DNA-binding protein